MYHGIKVKPDAASIITVFKVFITLFKADRTIFPSFRTILTTDAAAPLLKINHEQDIITLHKEWLITQTSPGDGTHDKKPGNQQHSQ
jgi:hypothetical protein